MSENPKINERCIKGNTTYYKIKIADMIKYEIDEFGVNESMYQNFNSKISINFLDFTNEIILGGDFSIAMTKLRDETITECVESDKNSSSTMRPFFKDYIFDKIYTMGINIKKGILPDDFEKELEEAKLKIDEEQLQHDEEEKLRIEEEQQQEEEKKKNEIALTVEESAEEKPQDLVDNIFDYFLGNSKTSNTKAEKKPEKQKDSKKNKIKGE